MSPKSLLRITVLASAMALSVPVLAASPTVHDIYQAAEAGNYTQAQALMDQVLKEHPNSYQAHFVQAELLAKQGRFSEAQSELRAAEKIDPALPKIKPAAVDNLRKLLAQGQAQSKPQARSDYSQRPAAAAPASYGNNAGNSAGGGLPWGSILIFGGLLVGFIILASRFMQRRAQAQPAPEYAPAGAGWGSQGYPANGGYPASGGYPQQGYGPGYGQPAQPGLGSTLGRGLATGAAVGAGIVAGEALMRHFTGDGSREQSSGGDHARNDIVYDDPSRNELLRNDDMGGNDFGVSGGWDDGGGGGGDSGGSDDWT